MKKEITRHIEIDKNQFNHLIHHSVLNIFNAIKGTINLVIDNTGDKNAFSQSIQLCNELFESIYHPEKSRKKPANITIFKSVILKEAEELFAQYTDAKLNELEEFFYENMQETFYLLKKRLTELKIWGHDVKTWEYFNTDEIIEDIKEFLNALSKNSQYKYWFVFDEKELDERTYLVDIKIENNNEFHLLLPTMLIDCMHDLIANARKYTHYGGKISLKISNTPEQISIELSDNGRGIAEDDFDKIIEFGYRGKNIDEKETSAGGFGLTKTYYITKKNNGRFFIDSELNKGTTFTIELPKP